MLRLFFRKIPTVVWVIISYTALAILFTWPLVLHCNTHLLGAPEDNQQFYWNLWWWQKALGDGTNPFYTVWLFFPKGTSLLLHTISPFNAVLAQIFSLFFNLVTSFNLLIFFSLIVSGVSMYYMALDVVKDKRAAWLAGLIFTLAPRHISHIYHHLNIIGIQFIPLVILCVRRIWQGVRPYYFAVWTAAWLALTFYTDFYNALYVGLWCALFAIWQMIWERNDFGKKIKATAVAAFITCAVCAPLIYPMVVEKESADYPEWGWDMYGANLVSFVLPPPYHWLVGEQVKPYYKHIGLNEWESTQYLGMVVIGLGLYGWWRNRRELSFWLGTGIFFAVLSFGPILRVWTYSVGNYWPYYWLVQSVPIIQMAKTAGRFAIFLVLALALAAAFGARELMTRWQWRYGAKGAVVGVSVLVGLVVLEFAPGRAPLTPVQAPQLYYQIAQDTDPGAIVDVPAGGWPANEQYMLYQTVHQKPITSGAVSRSRADVADFLVGIQYTREFFKEHGLKYVALHRAFMSAADWQTWQKKLADAQFVLAANDGHVAIYRAY